MSRHIWSVACRSIITDQLTNSVSYVEAVESLATQVLPQPAPSLMIGSLFAREGDEATVHVRLRVIGPSGGVLQSTEDIIGNFGGKQRLRLNMQIGGFTISEPGRLEIAVEQKRGTEWHAEARLPLDIVVVSADQPMDASAPLARS